MVAVCWRVAAAAALVMSLSVNSLAADALKAGRELYEQKQYQQALEQLEAARRENPNDAEAAFLDGLTLIRLDMPAEAAAAWADYERLAKDHKSAEEIARLRTILLREENTRAAQHAVAEEKQLTAAAADPNAVAVGTFRGLGTADTAPLGKAITAMLIANLSAIPDVRVLERERVEILAQEAKLGGSGLVDKRTAVRAGKLLRAGRVIAGSYVDWTASPPHLRIESTVIDARNAAEVTTSSAEGMLDQFYDLISKTAATIAAGLGRPVEKLPDDVSARVQERHTKRLPAALAFGSGLDAKDRGDYPAARVAFETALHEDPGFTLARRELLALPASLISLAAVASAAEAAGPSTEKKGPWLTSTPVLVGAGVLAAGAIGGGVAAGVSGGGGGGGGTPSNPPKNPNPPEFTGVQNVSVTVGQPVRVDISATDPDRTKVKLTATNLPTGSTFTPVDGNPATATFTWTPNAPGSTTVTFKATDSGNPPKSTSANSIITVSQAPSSTTTTTMCSPLGTPCTVAGTCCSGDCAVTPDQTATVCCTALGKTCGTLSECCGGSTSCTNGVCCVGVTLPCSLPTDCCAGTTCSGGACCLPSGAPCNTGTECCSGICSGTCG
jgi:tetratricopeptide (TPR) repeat protein